MELGKAYDMAIALLDHHGLAGWRVEFDTAKRRAGVCRFADRVIGLSGPLTRLHDADEVRDTILHEIAHALVGPHHGHDEVWRRTAQHIGSSGARCLDSDAPRVVGAWQGICAAGHVRDRHRRPDRVVSCPECSPRFSLDHLFEWTHRGRPAAPHPNYLAELEALRAGRRMRLHPVGSRVRVAAPGEHYGTVGRVVKIGRTSYHLKVPAGYLRVLFAAVDPA